VQIGGILIDSERFFVTGTLQKVALARKHDLIYNVSRQFCKPPTCE
jgi:hypothetical protein